MKPADKNRSSRKGFVLLMLAATLVSGATFTIGSGRWRSIYAFFVQFHQQTLWASLLLLFVPALIVILLRTWGVEDIPYVEEAPELGSGRLRTLARRIARSRRDPYDQALLINELSELATQVIALNEGLDVSGARRLCRSGEWTEDAVILDLICYRRIPAANDQQFVPQFEHVLRLIERLLKGGTDIESHPSR
jgi:hypothetical protein